MEMIIFADYYTSMIGSEVLKYCHFYKEEANPPYEQKDGRRLLWLAEQWVCNEGFRLIDDKEPQFSIASYVASYVGKWEPYRFTDVMELYFSSLEDSSVKERIKEIYY